MRFLANNRSVGAFSRLVPLDRRRSMSVRPQEPVRSITRALFHPPHHYFYYLHDIRVAIS